MDPQAYRMLQRLSEIVNHDERKVVSQADIAQINGILETMLTIYNENMTSEESAEQTLLDTGEARRPPRVRPKKPWYAWLFGGD